MSSGALSSRDLYGLQCCVGDFDLVLERWVEEPFDRAVRYPVIKVFELIYHMAIKYFEGNSRRADEITTSDLQDLIRLADQEGLLRDGWLRWRSYRENRTRAAHMYREEIATAVTAALPGFAAEAHALHDNLAGRVERNG